MNKTRTEEVLFNHSLKIILLCLVFSGIFLILGNQRLFAYENPELTDFQQITVTGVVNDENGNPMPGVNVVIEGTNIGAITDVDGKFSINVSSQDAVLLISFIGYNQQRVRIAGRTTINVSMEPSVSALDEVIVVGYGVAKKSDITGSIASV